MTEENQKEDTEQAEEQEQAVSSDKFDFNTKVYELWHGELPLLQVFWLYYFSAIFVLKILAGILTPMANVFVLFQLIWAGFMVKPIMIAADNYEGSKHWALAAKIIAVLISIVVVLDLFF